MKKLISLTNPWTQAEVAWTIQYFLLLSSNKSNNCLIVCPIAFSSRVLSTFYPCYYIQENELLKMLLPEVAKSKEILERPE